MGRGLGFGRGGRPPTDRARPLRLAERAVGVVDAHRARRRLHVDHLASGRVALEQDVVCRGLARPGRSLGDDEADRAAASDLHGERHRLLRRIRGAARTADSAAAAARSGTKSFGARPRRTLQAGLRVIWHRVPSLGHLRFGPSSTNAMAKHTCPMHPEVVREGQGTCPTCGMALEPAIVQLEEGESAELVDMRKRLVVSAVFDRSARPVRDGRDAPGLVRSARARRRAARIDRARDAGHALGRPAVFSARRPRSETRAPTCSCSWRLARGRRSC